MSEAAGTLVTSILQRVRDSAGGAHPRATVLSLMSLAQRAVNAATDLVYETLTVTTEAKRQVYNLSTLAPNCISLKDVKDGGRSLGQLRVNELFYVDREWFRRLASRNEVFGQWGLDFAIFHPATPEAGSLDLTYTKMLNDMTLSPLALGTGTSNDPEANLTELPDDLLAPMLDLLEALLQLRQRKYAEATMATLRFSNAIQGYARVKG